MSMLNNYTNHWHTESYDFHLELPSLLKFSMLPNHLRYIFSRHTFFPGTLNSTCTATIISYVLHFENMR